MNEYIDIISRQNTTQFYTQYVQYISQLHVSAQRYKKKQSVYK